MQRSTPAMTFAIPLAALMAAALLAWPGRPPLVQSVAAAITPPGEINPNPTDEQRRQYLEDLWSAQRSAVIRPSTPGPLPLFRPMSGTPAPAVPGLEDNVRLGATLVTLHVKGPLLEVLGELARAGNLRIAATEPGLFHRPDLPEIRLDLDKQPLLEAIYQLCAQAGLQMQQVEAAAQDDAPEAASQPAGQGGPAPKPGSKAKIVLALNSIERGMGPWTVRGPFVYQVCQVWHRQPLAGDGEEFFRMALTAQFEPKLHVVAGPGLFELKEVVDDKGNSLLPKAPPRNPGGWQMADGQRGTLMEIPVKLAYPKDNAGRRIARFRAIDHVILTRATETVELPFPLTGEVRKDVGAMSLTVSSGVGGSSDSVYFNLQQGNRNSFDWEQIKKGALGTQASLSANGQALYQINKNQTKEGDDFIAWTIMWSSMGGRAETSQPDKLTIHVPVDVKNVDVPVAFDDLPMP